MSSSKENNNGKTKAAPASNTASASTPASSSAASTKNYFDTNWSQTARNMSNNCIGETKNEGSGASNIP